MIMILAFKPLLYYFKLSEQCLRLWVMATELAIKLSGIYASALFEKVAELRGCLLVKDAFLLKEAVAVGSQYFGPFV